jgi:hypothetical protein
VIGYNKGMEYRSYELFETVTDLSVTVDSNSARDLIGSVIEAEAERFRTSLMESRSATFIQLFDYLLDRSADKRAPKEIEIALAVFGKASTFDPSRDSMVRVHVHRLRQRLECFYEGSSGPRLLIPNGEYRVVLFDPPSEAGQDISSSPARARVSAKRIGTVILAINALLWGALMLTGHQRREPNVLAATSFWGSLSAGAQPAQIVVGDSYFFAETKNEKDVERLIMQPDIRSRKDLDAYLVGHPKDFYKLYDLDIHYASGATLKAVWSLMPVIHALEHSVEMPDLIPASLLSDEVLKARDLIYIGRLDGLGALRGPLFHASGFEQDVSSDEIVDRASGKHYVAGSKPSDETSSNNRTYDYDYGYVASLPGPLGKRVLVIAGMNDAAVSRMAELVADRRQLDLLAQHTGGSTAFEALYEVRTLGNLNLSTSLLVARPLKVASF